MSTWPRLASPAVRRVRDSDLDLLVNLPEGAGLFLLNRLKLDPEELLDVVVDVILDDGVKSRVRLDNDKGVVSL